MSAVAVRLPPGLDGVLSGSPRLFVHEGARQALERRLMAALVGPVSLAITDNSHAIVTHVPVSPSLSVPKAQTP